MRTTRLEITVRWKHWLRSGRQNNILFFFLCMCDKSCVCFAGYFQQHLGSSVAQVQSSRRVHRDRISVCLWRRADSVGGERQAESRHTGAVLSRSVRGTACFAECDVVLKIV